MKRILAAILFFSASVGAHATHNRAGEITVIQTGRDSIRILIKTFTYTLSAADRSQLTVHWGDGTSSVAPRVLKTVLPNNYYENHYIAEHGYVGASTYTILVQDPNRNAGVLNIPNSVNVIFSIKTTIILNAQLGQNSTPVLLNPPIDRAARGHRFIHNPAAYDPDGDSISYVMDTCREENGKPIPGYKLPQASDTLYIDHTTGDLVWDAPEETGTYNIAIRILEWRKRNGKYLYSHGGISRDMQIDVYDTDNRDPVNQELKDFCVQAGDTIIYDITSTDPDFDDLEQQAIGGPFVVDSSPATFDSISTGPGISTSRFTWQTNCSHVRGQPYNIIIKAEDKNPDIKLIDIDNFRVKVIAPAPGNPQIIPGSNTIDLYWDRSVCDNTEGYNIYRRDGPLDYVPDSCSNGVPANIGYHLVGSTTNRNDTVFTDNNEGTGLTQGIEYCYLVTSFIDDGTESYPSDEVCAVLVPGKPAILNVSVIRWASDGQIYLSWVKPPLDTSRQKKPYKYKIFRYNDMWGNNLTAVDSFFTDNLNDTSTIDEVNTLQFPYSYHVELYYTDTLGNFRRYGRKEIVSSTFLDIVSGDNNNQITIRKNVPWINYDYIIYRKKMGESNFDSIGISQSVTYIDDSLTNDINYCYKVKSLGWRNIDSNKIYTENWSHISCGTPIDTVPPCPPVLSVSQNCDSLYNELSWTNPNNSCADDVVSYRIYYSSRINQERSKVDTLFGWLDYSLFTDKEIIDSTFPATDTVYVHYPANGMAGCYAVTAVDSFGNESGFSSPFCVSNCVEFDLPNVFTPNGDGLNDYFKPSRTGYVDRVDMKIFNRWGDLVYRTGDPEINWNGRYMNTNKLVTPGVYYYLCDLYVEGLTGEYIMNKVGFVYVYTDKDARVPREK